VLYFWPECLERPLLGVEDHPETEALPYRVSIPLYLPIGDQLRRVSRKSSLFGPLRAALRSQTTGETHSGVSASFVPFGTGPHLRGPAAKIVYLS